MNSKSHKVTYLGRKTLVYDAYGTGIHKRVIIIHYLDTDEMLFRAMKGDGRKPNCIVYSEETHVGLTLGAMDEIAQRMYSAIAR
jgi:hypothetical protein